MNKMSLSLFAAGAMAVAGATHAMQNDMTFDVPQRAGEMSTMTHGAPNRLTDNTHHGQVGSHGPAIVLSAPVDTTVMGANPWQSDTQVTIIDRGPLVVDRNASAATFNVPAQAGEMSTMTGGAPNMSTNNYHELLQSGERVIIWRQ